MLTLDRSKVSSLLRTGDTRWIHRAGYDLMNYQPQATGSPSTLPRGPSLTDHCQNNWKSHLVRLQLAPHPAGSAALSPCHRRSVDVPDVTEKAMLVMVHRLETGSLQVSVLNFSDQTVTGRVQSQHLPPAGEMIDMLTDQMIAVVDDQHGFGISLRPHQGLSLLGAGRHLHGSNLEQGPDHSVHRPPLPTAHMRGSL